MDTGQLRLLKLSWRRLLSRSLPSCPSPVARQVADKARSSNRPHLKSPFVCSPIAPDADSAFPRAEVDREVAGIDAPADEASGGDARACLISPDQLHHWPA